MTLPIIGILTVIFGTVAFAFAWWFASKRNYHIAVFLLILGGFILRVYTASDPYLHEWDERYHALVAKNLISDPLKPTLYADPVLPYDYKDWSSNHVWLHKQPLPLWAMAASMSLFGINELALRLPSILLTCFAILFLYLIGRSLFNEQIAFLAAFFLAINGLIIEISAGRVATDHIDVFFLFFILLAIYLSLLFSKSKRVLINILAGVAIGAAILSKWLPALIVLPIWLLFVIDSQRFSLKEMAIHFSILLVVCFATFLPWQIYIYQAFPLEANWEASFNMKHITEVLDNRSGPFYYFFNQIRINYGELIWLPMGWFVWKFFQNGKNLKHLAILIWIFVPLLFFSIVKTKMQGYVLFISPALFLVTAAFWYSFRNYQIQNNWKWLQVVLLAMFIILPIRYSIERIKPFDDTGKALQSVTEIQGLNRMNIDKGILLNHKRPIEAMYYTGLTTYTHIPDLVTIHELLDKGYTILVNDKPNIPKEVRAMDNIKFVELTD